MLWLLIPIFGTVVAATAAAVVCSEDTDKEAAERLASAKERARAEALAKREASEKLHSAREQQLAGEIKRQLDVLFKLHSDVVQRPVDAILRFNVEALHAYVAVLPPSTPQALLSKLRLLVPEVLFSSQWLNLDVEASTLRDEIRSLKYLKHQLRNRAI